MTIANYQVSNGLVKENICTLFVCKDSMHELGMVILWYRISIPYIMANMQSDTPNFNNVVIEKSKKQKAK